jgi:hypothetical protein
VEAVDVVENQRDQDEAEDCGEVRVHPARRA